MTNAELCAEVVRVGKSRAGKNQYTQGDKRMQVGSGWSDCSSFVRWCYLQVIGQDVGLNTVAQIQNKSLLVVNEGGKTPDPEKLLPGDLIYYKGTDKSRPYMVGHVEMYIGNGQIIGHGSGVGPTIKNLKTYSASRYNSGKGYIRALRVIQDQQAELQGPCALVTGDTVNVRSGPGSDYPSLGVVKKGRRMRLIDGQGWRLVEYNGQRAWISDKLTERVE